MDNAVYATLSRQMAQFRKLDVTANNIANVDTTGFKAEKTLFTHYLAGTNSGEEVAMAHDVATYRDTSAGRIETTGNPLAVALEGPGYMQVRTEYGDRYTRAGAFERDLNGQIVNPQGNPVLDDAGQPIVLEQGDYDVMIGTNGLITVLGAEGAAREVRGQIGVFEFQDEQSMTRVDGTQFISDEVPVPAVETTMIQGALEKSNVSSVEEMVTLTKLSRGVGSTAKFIETMFELQRKTSDAYTKPS